MDKPVYKCVINKELASDLEVNYVALVDRPAIEKNFLLFTEAITKPRFFLNEEKRIICGPAMIADLLIYRNDQQFGEYYVQFDKETIYTIAEKFAAKNFMNNVNLMHDPAQQPGDVTIFQSFISDSETGIAPMKGFEDAPDGSWFMAMKVNNDAVWAKVKSGEFKGFSVEGIFQQIPVKMNSNRNISIDFNLNDLLSEEDKAEIKLTIIEKILLKS